jgi:hypothetical protein
MQSEQLKLNTLPINGQALYACDSCVVSPGVAIEVQVGSEAMEVYLSENDARALRDWLTEWLEEEK